MEKKIVVSMGSLILELVKRINKKTFGVNLCNIKPIFLVFDLLLKYKET